MRFSFAVACVFGLGLRLHRFYLDLCMAASALKMVCIHSTTPMQLHPQSFPACPRLDSFSNELTVLDRLCFNMDESPYAARAFLFN